MPTDDTIAARYRMRKLRAQQGGMTVYDRARNYAIGQTIKAHRGTYEFFRMDFLNKHRATRRESRGDVGQAG